MIQIDKPVETSKHSELIYLHNPKFPTSFDGQVLKKRKGRTQYRHKNKFTKRYELVYNRTNKTKPVRGIDGVGEATVFEFEKIIQKSLR